MYTAIMAVGLSVSMALVIIFTCYVKQQLAVCNHYPDSDRIYLVGMSGQSYSYSNLARELEEAVPELEEALLVEYYYNSYTYEGRRSSDESVLVVGKDFFNVFKTRFLYGSPEEFNSKTNAFVTESFAQRNGGIETVIGKKLIDGSREYVIAGVIEDFANTVFQDYEVILNLAADEFASSPNSMGSAIKTFIKVSEGADMDAIRSKVEKQASSWYERVRIADSREIELIRLDKLYLSEVNKGNMGLKTENRDRLILFSIVVIFILISAIFNYVNLNTANAELRAKELAIRIIVGEEKRHVIGRILAESFGFVSFSFIISLLISLSLVGTVNDLLNTVIPVELSFTWDYIVIYLLIAVLIGLLCGLSVALNTFRVRVRSSNKRQRSMSRLFIGLQFDLSLIMISSAITMELQMKHMLGREMNANFDNIYNTNYTSPELLRQIEQLPYVKSIGQSKGYPSSFGMMIRGGEDSPVLPVMNCDSIAFRLFGFDIADQFSTSGVLGTWMSETAANHYNINEDNREWNGPGFNYIDDTVTGVIKDTPTTNVLNMDLSGLAIVSVLQREQIGWGGYFLEVEESAAHRHVLDSLVTTLCLAEQDREAMGHGFLRDLPKQRYNQTIRDMRLIELFMFIAIMLSCLAFLAMSMHYANRNQSTIGIHKVFGGSTGSELLRNMGVYFKIMGAAVIVGLPIAVWVSGRYLEQFTYRFSLGDKWWIFPIAILIALTISTLTVLWQTLHAARTNPAEVLKKE